MLGKKKIYKYTNNLSYQYSSHCTVIIMYILFYFKQTNKQTKNISNNFDLTDVVLFLPLSGCI